MPEIGLEWWDVAVKGSGLSRFGFGHGALEFLNLVSEGFFDEGVLATPNPKALKPSTPRSGVLA